MSIFKQKFLELQRRSDPKLSIEFFYITRLDVEPNRNAQKAAEILLEEVLRYYSQTTVEPFRFVNVASLYTQYRVSPPSKKVIPLVTSFPTKEGYVGLVTIKDYYDFLKAPSRPGDLHPQLDEYMFDANVRGYQLSAPVNRRITYTLTGTDRPEFWLLNNGITILTPLANNRVRQLNYGD
jgi:hypothetical protein